MGYFEKMRPDKMADMCERNDASHVRVKIGETDQFIANIIAHVKVMSEAMPWIFWNMVNQGGTDAQPKKIRKTGSVNVKLNLTIKNGIFSKHGLFKQMKGDFQQKRMKELLREKEHYERITLKNEE